MKITKYSKSGSSNPALSGGSGGSSSSTEYIGSSLNRTIWGQEDTGDDVDGSMTVHGNINICVIEDLPDVGEDEDNDDGDGEVEEYETGGGSLFVDLTVKAKDIEAVEDLSVGRHLFINYPAHPEHSTDNKKCIGEILYEIESDISTNKSEISSLKSRVSVNEVNISTNADEIEKLKNRTSANETTINEYLPIGTIIMFNGLASTIPDNWAICDGTNGTPNLINKFIKAATVSGNTGGNNNITLTANNMPAHSHVFRNYLIQVHGNDEILNGTMTLDGEEVTVGHSAEKSANPTRRAQTDNSDHSQVPYIQHKTYSAGNANPSGFDIQPEFYTLIFIMKVA